MRIVILGSPGVGKGTIAGMIKDKLGISHISTGDILREELKKDSELGREIKACVQNGKLVPDEIITRIVDNKFMLEKEQLKKGFILDGFPRTQAQAEDLNKILEKAGITLDFALYMKAAMSTILTRITGRRVCRKCGALYHIKALPPKVKNTCDKCGGELYQRSDDNAETIKTRIKIYNDSTKPVIDFYKKQKRLRILDANKESTEIFQDLMASVNENQSAH